MQYQKLNAAKPFDPEKPAATRDGLKVTALVTFKNANGRMAGTIEDDTAVYVWHDGGRYLSGDHPHGLDLVNVSTTQRRWVNHYPLTTDAFFYETEEGADEAATGSRLAGKAFLIEWEE